MTDKQKKELKDLGLIFGGAAISVTIIIVINTIGTYFGIGI